MDLGLGWRSERCKGGSFGVPARGRRRRRGGEASGLRGRRMVKGSKLSIDVHLLIFCAGNPNNQKS